MRARIALGVAALGLLMVVALLVLSGGGAASADASRLSGYGLLHQDQWTVAVSGAGAGSASGPAGGMEGRIYAVYLDYTSGISSTTDVTLTVGSPAMTVLTKTNYLTDSWYYPGVQLADSDGSALSGAYTARPAMGTLLLSMGETNGTLTVTVLWGQ